MSAENAYSGVRDKGKKHQQIYRSLISWDEWGGKKKNEQKKKKDKIQTKTSQEKQADP